MSNTRHVQPDADGPAQVDRAGDLQARMVGLALAHDTDGLGALGDQYVDNPVVLSATCCLLAQEVARLTEDSARDRLLLRYAIGRVQGVSDTAPLAFRKAD